MKQLMFIPLLVLLAGKWFSLEFVGRSVAEIEIYKRSVCNQTRFGNTCLKTFFNSHGLPLRKSFEDASEICRAEFPGSTLIVIKSEDDQRMVETFINSQALGNETIITDARKLSDNDSWTWLWVNGEETISEDVRFVGHKLRVSSGVVLIYLTNPVYSAYDVSVLSRYICEYASSSNHSQSNFSYWQNNKSYVASASDATWYDARKECLRLGGDLASITDRRMLGDDWSWLTKDHKYWIGCHQNKWIWNSTDAAITYTNWEGGHPTESSDRQCICLGPQCKNKHNREVENLCRYWVACNCNDSYAVICQTASTSTDEKSARPNTTKLTAANMTAPKTTTPSITPSTRPVTDTVITTTSKTPSISSVTQEPSISDDYSTAVPAERGAYLKPTSSTRVETSTIAENVSVSVAITSISTDGKPSRPDATKSIAAKKTALKSTATGITPVPRPTLADLKPSSSNSVETTTVAENGLMSVAIASTSTDGQPARPNATKSTAAKPTTHKTTTPSITPSTRPVTDTVRTTTSKTPSTSFTTQEPSISDDYSTSVSAEGGGLFNSIGTKEIVILLLLFVAVVIIVVAVFLVIRKRKQDKRSAGSTTENKEPSKTVACVYATVVPDTKQSAEDTAPPGNTIYAEVEMDKRPSPSNNTTDSSNQQTDTVVDMVGNVVYADLDLPQKGQKRLETVDQIAACPSAIQTQPSEPSTSPSCPVYAEPLKPDEKSKTVASVHSHHTISDQQNIPESLPDPAGKEVKATDSIYDEAIKVKPGAESGDDDMRDPSAIYAEPIKIKKPK